MRKIVELSIIVTVVGLCIYGGKAYAAQDDKGVQQLLSNIQKELITIQNAIEGISCNRVATIKGIAYAEGGAGAKPISGEKTLVSLTGPGTLVAALLQKQGGACGLTCGLTSVWLEVDGQTILDQNIIALKNLGLNQYNPFGVVVFTGPTGIDTVTIGFPQPIAFTQSLKLKTIVIEENVEQIIGRVIYGE